MSVGYYSSDFPRPSKSDTSFSGVQGEDHWHLLSSASSSVSTQWSFFGMFGRTLGSRDEAIQKQKQRNLQGQERLEALQEAKQNQWNLQECHENDNYWFEPMGYPFKFGLFFLLRTTILYYDSSKYPIQLTQYYQMSQSSKIDSFNTINIIF